MTIRVVDLILTYEGLVLLARCEGRVDVWLQAAPQMDLIVSPTDALTVNSTAENTLGRGNLADGVGCAVNRAPAVIGHQGKHVLGREGLKLTITLLCRVVLKWCSREKKTHVARSCHGR